MRRIDTCKRGHDQTVEGARSPTNGCIACRKVRDQKREAALPPKPPRIPNSIPGDLIAELLQLHSLSSKTRGFTPIGHEYRTAGDLLAELAMNAMEEFGVTANALSVQMGLSPQTMRFFLMRRGALDVTAGMEKHIKNYENVRKWGRSSGGIVTACKRGHSYLEENARNKWGTCRACEKELKKARYDPAKERAKYLAKKLAA